MAIKKGDFVEIDYVGRVKETNAVFDVTNAELAKQHHVHNPKMTYHSQIVCVGEQHVVPGLDAFLEGRELKTYTVSLSPEQAFGKKDPKLMQLLPMTQFHKEKINPFPGLQLNLNGMMGIVRSVSGGRVIVDFNHPLAGRDVVYELTIKQVVTDAGEQLKGVLYTFFHHDVSFTLKDGKAAIHLPVQEPLANHLKEHLRKLIPSIKEISFASSQRPQPKQQ